LFRGRIKVMSTIALHSTLNISDTVRDAWLQIITNRKWHMRYQMVTWAMTSRDRQRCCEAVRSATLATAWLLVVIFMQSHTSLVHCECFRDFSLMRGLLSTGRCSALAAFSLVRCVALFIHSFVRSLHSLLYSEIYHGCWQACA